jgi:hypothetical protein
MRNNYYSDLCKKSKFVAEVVKVTFFKFPRLSRLYYFCVA